MTAPQQIPDIAFSVHLQRQGGFSLQAEQELSGAGFTVLFGPSGCGKTTLLRWIAGLEPAGQGWLTVKGKSWQNQATFLPAHKRNVGYVFQGAGLFPHMSVLNNILYGVRRPRYSVNGKSSASLGLDPVIELLGIAPLLDRKPAGLSGGERQRVAIARALASQPGLLLMDEPLAALDQQRKLEVLPYLQRMQSELQLPVLYVTHSSDEVLRLAHHIVAMREGRVIASGPLQQIAIHPDLPFTQGDSAHSVVLANVLDRDSEYHLLRLSIGNQQLLVRDLPTTSNQVRVSIVARDVSLTLNPQTDSSILNCLRTTVLELRDGGHLAQQLVLLDLEGQTILAKVTRRSVDQLGIRVGMPIWANIKTMSLT